MRRSLLLFGPFLLAGCGLAVEDAPELWPPPRTGTTIERGEAGEFDPCPQIVVETPRQLSSSVTGTSDPRIAWNPDSRQFMVVWREGDEIVLRRLEADGAPRGLEWTLRGENGEAVTSDPAVLAVPGEELSPFFVTVQTGGVIGVDRILDDDQPVRGERLDAALPTDVLPREARIPAMSTDGDRISVAYRTDGSDVLLVSLRLVNTGEAWCLHREEAATPVVCKDNAVAAGIVAAVGWLPPRPDEPGATAAQDPAGRALPWWWMLVRRDSTLQWVTLGPPAIEGDPLGAGVPHIEMVGNQDFRAGPRIASGSHRLAVALRRGDDASVDNPMVTQAWQLTDDEVLACVVSTPDLSAGTPAVTWAHGRRLAVVGLTTRHSGATDVVIARADAPFTEADRLLATQQGRVCPEPRDVVEVTAGERARDPDVAFSGDALGVVWAQEDDVADVWFARARCVAP